VRAGRIGKESLPTHENPKRKSFFTAPALMRYSLRSNKAQATGVRCASHISLGQFPAPNPVEHFFEACKPRKPTAQTKAHSLQKNVNLSFVQLRKKIGKRCTSES
jgi:hypothetical protein